MNNLVVMIAKRRKMCGILKTIEKLTDGMP